MTLLRSALAFAVLLAASACSAASTAVSPSDPGSPLVEQRTIPLPGVAGRIDHLAIDALHHRVFVAELGNGSVDEVDLDSGATRRISGLKEPQGVAYLPDRNELVVASGGDGSVRFYDANDLALKATMTVGDDADNLRVDPATGFVAVGYGSGAIALIDPARRVVVKSIALPAHPEGFRPDPSSKRVFVNLPNAHLVATADWDSNSLGRWPAGHALNFPMALDAATSTIAIAYRMPSRLVLIDAANGTTRQDLETCGDADDVYFDPPRKRLNVICGAGAVDVFERSGVSYAHLAQVNTRPGARTGLFSEELGELIVAARSTSTSSAALIVLRPR